MIVPRPRTWVAAVAAALVLVVPAPAAASVHITTTPGLAPGFKLDVPDYVARCEPGKPLHFAVSATNGDRVAIGDRAKAGGSFTVGEPLARGAPAPVRGEADGKGATHPLRC